MRDALGAFEIVGLTTNVGFLSRLVSSTAFAGADLDTGLIERSRDELFPPPAAVPDEVLALATSAELLRLGRESRTHAVASGDPWSPWSDCDGWRLNQDNHHVFVFKAGERQHAVTVHYRPGGVFEVELPGGRRMLACEPAGTNGVRAWLDDESIAATVVRSGATIDVFCAGERHTFELHDPWLAEVEADVHGGGLTAPMPGKVIAVLVDAGAKVERGVPLLIMEAMKMEHTIMAPAAGAVREILYGVGDQVAEGAELIRVRRGVARHVRCPPGRGHRMRQVKVLLYIPKAPEKWRDAFVRALPEAEVRMWAPGGDWQADYAAFWYPPRELLDGQTHIKAAFNLGAGVDATLKALALPAGVPLVRLEDAGMGRQMEEYVAWAVLRYFRRLDDYAAQQARAEWKVHAPRRHAEFPVGVMGLGVLGTRLVASLRALGFPVLGWSANAKALEGVQTFAGRGELEAFLRAHARARVHAPAHARHRRAAEPRHARQAPAGRVPRERRARRSRGGRRSDRAAGFRASRRRDARRVPPGAAAGRAPLLVASESVHHAAYLGADDGRGFGRAGRGEDPRARAGATGHRHASIGRAGTDLGRMRPQVPQGPCPLSRARILSCLSPPKSASSKWVRATACRTSRRPSRPRRRSSS